MASCRKVALVKGENRYSNTYNALNLIKPDLEKLKNAKKILIKPNLTASSNEYANTNARTIEAVIDFINENFLEWRALPMAMTKPIPYGIEIEGNDYTQVKGLGFSTTDWIMPENSPSIVRHIYLGGELWGSNPKRSGKLTAITGV